MFMYSFFKNCFVRKMILMLKMKNEIVAIETIFCGEDPYTLLMLYH